MTPYAIFNGYDLSRRFAVGNLERRLASFANDYETVPGRPGAVHLNTAPALVVIALRLTHVGGGRRERHEALVELAAALAVDSPAPLALSVDEGLYYMASPDGDIDIERYMHADSMVVQFLALDPVRYGEQQSATVPSGGSVTFRVGGTYRTAPLISATAAVRNASSGVWGIRLDEGDFVHVATGSAAARAVAIDNAARTATVTGSVVVPTLDSDWLELEPGEHTLRNDQGTGAATVTWVERWL